MAPSPQAVTTCRRGVVVISPAANMPGIFVIFCSSTMIKFRLSKTSGNGKKTALLASPIYKNNPLTESVFLH